MKEDSEQILSWRNNPEVFKFFFNPNPVTQDEHGKWFNNILTRSNIYFFMGILDEIPVGTVRFDKIDEESFEVGVYLDPTFFGKGLGTQLLQQGEDELLKLIKEEKIDIVAKVLPENEASIKLFNKGGYNKQYIKLKKEVRNRL